MPTRFPALALLLALLAAAAGCATTEPGASVSAWPPSLAVLDATPALMERDLAEPLPAPAAALPPDGPAAPPASPEALVARPAPVQMDEVPPDPRPPAETMAFIARDRVNLRPCAAETPRCPPIASLRFSEEVRVTQEGEAWLLVRVPRLDRGGYIARRFVSATRPPRDAVVAAPVAAAPARDARGATPGAKRVREAPSAPPPEEELLQ
jgi:hypothetical protein